VLTARSPAAGEPKSFLVGGDGRGGRHSGSCSARVHRLDLRRNAVQDVVALHVKRRGEEDQAALLALILAALVVGSSAPSRKPCQ
jgi:hypothetical protein